MKVKSNVKAGAISVKVDFHSIAAVETTSTITVDITPDPAPAP